MRKPFKWTLAVLVCIAAISAAYSMFAAWSEDWRLGAIVTVVVMPLYAVLIAVLEGLVYA